MRVAMLRKGTTVSAKAGNFLEENGPFSRAVHGGHGE
jgi:hypothetical protein